MTRACREAWRFSCLHPGIRLRGRRHARRRQRVDRRRLRVGIGRDRVHPGRPEPVHPGIRGSSSVRRTNAVSTVRLRPWGRVGAAGPGPQRGRPGDLPLPHRLRNDVRPHRQYARLHPVHGGLTRRTPLGGRLDQPSDNVEAGAGGLRTTPEHLPAGGLRSPPLALCIQERLEHRGQRLGRHVVGLTLQGAELPVRDRVGQRAGRFAHPREARRTRHHDAWGS